MKKQKKEEKKETSLCDLTVSTQIAMCTLNHRKLKEIYGVGGSKYVRQKRLILEKGVNRIITKEKY